MLDTNLISFVLSQFFGLYLVIVAVIMFGHANHYRHLIKKTSPESGTVLLAGLVGLMLGLFLVGIHNVWIFKPAVLITLFCWFVLIASVCFLATPMRTLGWLKRLCSGSNYYRLASFWLVLGLMFLGRGVYQYAIHHQSFLFLA